MQATPIAINPSRRSPRYVLAIDLGSGGHKAAIVSDTGEIIASASEAIATQMLPDGGAEQDPIQWWNGARRTAKQAIEQSGVSPRDIVAVGCDSQWSVVVAVDENGEPLMNAVHWLDTRGGKYNRKISGGFPRIQGYNLYKLFKWLRLTGLVPTHSGVDSLGHVPFKKTDVSHMMGSLPSPFKDKFILLAEQGTGGRCLEFYLKNLVYPEDEFGTGAMPADAYERFNVMAGDSPAGSGGVIFLPWLNGSIAPCENPYMRGGFMNLSLKTTRAHMTRAIMEGLAFNSRWTHAAAQKFIGRPIDSYRFSGGGALSSVWSQIHADILGVPIHQVDDPVNTTVRGTAMLALTALGHRTIAEIPALVKVRQVFEPDTSRRHLYDRMYDQYRKIFKKSKNVYTTLNAQKEF